MRPPEAEVFKELRDEKRWADAARALMARGQSAVRKADNQMPARAMSGRLGEEFGAESPWIQPVLKDLTAC